MATRIVDAQRGKAKAYVSSNPFTKEVRTVRTLLESDSTNSRLNPGPEYKSDRMIVTRRALVEAGHHRIAGWVRADEYGDPCLAPRKPVTEAEVEAFCRAAILGHRSDPDGIPVRCCQEMTEAELHEAHTCRGDERRPSIPACTDCPGAGMAWEAPRDRR